MPKQDHWTPEDEAQLNALQQRRKETFERDSEKLMAVIKQTCPIKSGSVSEISIYDLRNSMIHNGGAFRDALEPFDHMGRPQAADATET